MGIPIGSYLIACRWYLKCMIFNRYLRTAALRPNSTEKHALLLPQNFHQVFILKDAYIICMQTNSNNMIISLVSRYSRCPFYRGETTRVYPLQWRHNEPDGFSNHRRLCFHTRTTRPIAEHIEGILPNGPYPSCLRMADRALLAGYPR